MDGPEGKSFGFEYAAGLYGGPGIGGIGGGLGGIGVGLGGGLGGLGGLGYGGAAALSPYQVKPFGKTMDEGTIKIQNPSSLLAFNRVHRLEIQSVMLVFSTPLVN